MLAEGWAWARTRAEVSPMMPAPRMAMCWGSWVDMLVLVLELVLSLIVELDVDVRLWRGELIFKVESNGVIQCGRLL